ncbi:MAG TPA: hypothetical protein VF116_12745 [Ktedonobacterales bacterium]
MLQGSPAPEPVSHLDDNDINFDAEADALANLRDEDDIAPPEEREEDTLPALDITSRPTAAVPQLHPHAARRAANGPLPVPRSRPRPLPAVDPIPPLAGVQVAVAVCGALSGATLLVVGRPTGWWPLTLAIISGLGGWLASLLAAHPRRAGGALLASQLLALGWALALVGPRSAMLAVAALIVLVALWLCGRGAAAIVAALAAALYIAAAALTAVSVLRPSLVLDASAGAVFDGAVSCLALLLMLRLALRLHTTAAKAEALAAARAFELDVVHGRSAVLRRQVERDAERLRQALREAQTGAPAPAVHAAGALSPLADEIEVTAARLHALHRDREQRRALERGIYRLVRALERAWLGLPWEWPEPSGTKLDDVVALLRSPNPREIARAHLDDTSGLLPIPTLDAAHTPPWAPPRPHPLAPLAEPEPLWSSGELRATYRNSGQLARQPVLPWDEWDDWRGWDPSEEE